MEAVRTSETSVDNHFTRQYIPEDNSEQSEGGLAVLLLYIYNAGVTSLFVLRQQRLRSCNTIYFDCL
jgi:hypothetical protein